MSAAAVETRCALRALAKCLQWNLHREAGHRKGISLSAGETLEKRCVKTKRSLNTLSKEDLVELFHKYVTSYPQRRWRENRRGRKMNKFIEKIDDTVSHKEDRLKSPPLSQTANVNRRFAKLNNYQRREEMRQPTDQRKRKVDKKIAYDEPGNKSRKISWP
uniref:Uncharacterized protein n=1 Tax=Strigamia maritima TaxID=126957 RepID=T1JC85_STRMM